MLYGVVGVALGFIVIAAATRFAGRPGREPHASELRVRWADRENAAGLQTEFEGECMVERPEGRLVIFFASGGRWTVRVNGSVAYRGVVPDGRRASVGRAADWLDPGPNRIVATHESGVVGSKLRAPPKLLLE